MKISAKTLVVVAGLGVGAGLLLPMAGNSQIRIKRPTPALVVPDDNPASFDNKRIKDGITTVRVPSEMDKLTDRVDALEAKVAAQQTQITAQQVTIAEQNVRIEGQQKLISGHPAGYTKAFITLANFSHLSPNDAINYWARY